MSSPSAPASQVLRRMRFGGLALTLASGAALALPHSAQAAVLDTANLSSAVAFGGSGSCTASGPGATSAPAAPFAADGVPVSSSSSSYATYTKDTDPADVTNLASSITTRARATQVNNALRTVDLSMHSTQTVSPALGSAQTCSAAASISGSAVGSFDLPSPKVVTIDTEATPGAFFQLTFVRSTAPTQYHQVASLGVRNDNHTQFVLGPGTYTVQFIAQSTLAAPTPTAPTPSTEISDVTASVVFSDPGVADSTSTGSGTKYLSLAEGRSCAAGSLTATWKAKAGKGDKRTIKKAVFRVDGAKVKTVKKPKKGTTTTLSGLPATKNVEVTVTMKLAKKGAGTVAVERSYLACG